MEIGGGVAGGEVSRPTPPPRVLAVSEQSKGREGERAPNVLGLLRINLGEKTSLPHSLATALPLHVRR